jgi:hypothetical protein
LYTRTLWYFESSVDWIELDARSVIESPTTTTAGRWELSGAVFSREEAEAALFRKQTVNRTQTRNAAPPRPVGLERGLRLNTG